jgi:hypothetical protein
MQFHTTTPAARRSTSLEAMSTSAVNACRFGPGFVRPAYEDFCFSSLPGFFEQLLTGSTSRGNFPPDVVNALGRYDHVIFVFFDAFGWESFQRFRASSQFLRRFDTNGVVMKTTAQFPSTTAAHVTTMMSGKPAFTHEVCGWNYYEPRAGRMIKPLPFSFSEDKEPGTLAAAGFAPSSILPPGSFFDALTRNAVNIELHGPKAFFPSPFGTRYADPSFFRGFTSLREGLGNVRASLTARVATTYRFLYADAYDVTCHQHGVGSNQADSVAQAMLDDLCGLTEGSFPPRTLLVLSADHGQITDAPEKIIPINHIIPNITEYLKRDAIGNPIRFSGGRHHLFLHPRDSAREHLLAELRGKLAGAAEVAPLAELSKMGLLGPNPIPESYAERLGSIGILPHARHAVYWEEPPAFTNDEPSTHGGVTWQEMETPLLLLPLG